MGILVFWLIASIIIGFAAGSRNRSCIGWFLISLIISPLLAFVGLMLMGSAESDEEIAAKAKQANSAIDEYNFVKSEFMTLYCNNPEFEKKPHIKELYLRLADEVEPNINQLSTIKTAVQFMS
ncbi:MAG: hypothetical protein ACRC2Y_04335 [Aeromonas veronii]